MARISMNRIFLTAVVCQATLFMIALRVDKPVACGFSGPESRLVLETALNVPREDVGKRQFDIEECPRFVPAPYARHFDAVIEGPHLCLVVPSTPLSSRAPPAHLFS